MSVEQDGTFRYPSYVQDIMGPMCFDYGFGPFRWVCTSGKPEDLDLTDRIAMEVMTEIAETAPDEISQQMHDNIRWIREAKTNKLVVGSQARILYADAEGRIKIASAFNEAVKSGKISAPVVLGFPEVLRSGRHLELAHPLLGLPEHLLEHFLGARDVADQTVR